MSPTESNGPVFYDPRGKRKQHVGRLALLLGGAASLLALVFILSVLFQPLLPGLAPTRRLSALPPLPVAGAPEVCANRGSRAVNTVHGSDSSSSAARELAYFFGSAFEFVG